MPGLTVAEIARICGGQAEGDTELLISGASSLENASATDLVFVANEKAFTAASSSRAGCLLVPTSFPSRTGRSLIRVPNPRTAFTRAVAVLLPQKPAQEFVNPTALIARTATVARGCFIGAYATIGENTHIGRGCSIGNGCALGDHVSIGEETTLYANVTIYDKVQVGARVILHSGCVIGADGFGFTLEGDHYEKFPQIGTIEIEDDVEIGANCCIDRAALGVTRIGAGTKLDNLVHVGHNCMIGKHVVVAAQTGFSGGVVVGNDAVIGGQAGIGERAHIESKAVVGGKSGILPSQRVRAGEPVWGIPARPLRRYLKGLANLEKLQELREELRQIRRKLGASADLDG